MEVLDTSVVNVSLPHIAGSLSSSTEEATWVLTSYIVANAIILPITGWLANYLGRKRLLMMVITGFTLSSALCGAAHSLPALILFRILQGTTGGGIQPLSQAVLLEEFPGKERGKAMAFWGMGIIVAPILGPTVGGWITDNFTWRWVFYINLPVGILSFILIALFVFDPPYIRRGSLRIDFWGLGMLAVGMGSLQIMLDKGQEKDWFGSDLIRTLAVLAFVFLTGFIIRELIAKEPIVRFKLFRYPTFATGIALVTILGFVLYGSLVLLPLFMQTLLGWTATIAGFWMSPRGLATGLCMPIVGYLLGRNWDERWMLAAGFAVAGISFFGFAHMTLQSGTWDIFWDLIGQGAAMAFIFVPLTTLTMAPIPKEDTGYATSLYSVMRNIGSSVGVSFVTTNIARRSQFHQQVLAANITPESLFRPEFQSLAAMLRQRGFNATAAAHGAQSIFYQKMMQQAALLSYVESFRLMGILFLAIIPLIALMRRAKHHEPAPGSSEAADSSATQTPAGQSTSMRLNAQHE